MVLFGQKYRTSFNETSLRLAMNYLLGKCCFTLGSINFGQMTAIPIELSLIYVKNVAGILHITRTTTHVSNLVTRINLLLMQMKK